MFGRRSNVSSTWPIHSSICSLLLRIFIFEVPGHENEPVNAGIKKLGLGQYGNHVQARSYGRLLYIIAECQRNFFPRLLLCILRVPVRSSFDPFASIRSRNRINRINIRPGSPGFLFFLKSLLTKAYGLKRGLRVTITYEGKFHPPPSSRPIKPCPIPYLPTHTTPTGTAF